MRPRFLAVAVAAAAVAVAFAAAFAAPADSPAAAPSTGSQTVGLDYGDAPDGAPARYARKPRVRGAFPSRAARGGPRHPESGPRIGTGWNGEADSRQVDADADDGASLEPRSCATSTLRVFVDATRADPATPIYLNAWFDWNADGDWADGGTLRCRPEWAIQNQRIRPETLGAERMAVLTLRFRAGRVPDQFWWRVQVHSGDPVPHFGGGGQSIPTRGGEVEDRLYSRLPGVRRPFPILICQVGGIPANETVYPHGGTPDFLVGFVGVRPTDRLSARSFSFRVRGDTNGIVVRRVPQREVPHRVWALRLSSREHERDPIQQKVRIEFTVVALLNGQLQPRYMAPCSVTIFHARGVQPPVDPPPELDPPGRGPRVEIVMGSPWVGFTHNAGEFTGVTGVTFVNQGPGTLPAGSRLEVTASRAVTFSATALERPQRGSPGRPAACTQATPSTASCALPELRPQAFHVWDTFARTRERGALRLTFAIRVPASSDPTPNAPLQITVPIP